MKGVNLRYADYLSMWIGYVNTAAFIEGNPATALARLFECL
jgi:hypothetical protein